MSPHSTLQHSDLSNLKQENILQVCSFEVFKMSKWRKIIRKLPRQIFTKFYQRSQESVVADYKLFHQEDILIFIFIFLITVNKVNTI